MSFISKLFKKPKGTPGQVVDVTPPEFEAIRAPVAGGIEGLLGGGPAAPEPFVAPITGPEEALVGQIAAGAGQPDPLLAAAGQSAAGLLGAPTGDPLAAFPGAGDAITQFLSGGGQGAVSPEGLFQPDALGDFIKTLTQRSTGGELEAGGNPFLQAAIDAATRPVIENFERAILPRLRSQFTLAGQNIGPGGSSPFDVAAAGAGTDVLRNIGDISTDLSFQAFEAERGRQTEATDLLARLGLATGEAGTERAETDIAATLDSVRAAIEASTAGRELDLQQQQQAVSQATTVSREELDQTVQSLQAVALPRLIDQLGLDAGLAEFSRRIDVLLEALGLGVQAGTPRSEVIQPTAASGKAGIFDLIDAGVAIAGAGS